MISIAITSQKGGVGKTTVAVNLAYALARRGWNTLLMDTDPQGSVGLSLSEKARKCQGFYDALRQGVNGVEYILHTRLPELKIMPAGQVETIFDVKTPGADARAALDRMLAAVAETGVDVVIVDTPAGLTGYTADVLRVVDYAVVPQQAEPLGVRSLPQMLGALQQLRQQGARLQLAGLLLTMMQHGQHESAEVGRELRQIIPPRLMFESVVPRDPLFLKASGLGVPLGLLYANPPAAAVVFDHLAAELESRLHLHAPDDALIPTRLMD
ncbi:MAG: ParA family protein [Verrucomicrobiales bacterium]